jgi:hypothetical protein
MLKKITVIGLLFLLLLALAGCAAGPNTQKDAPNVEGKVAGFWTGLWHGIIAPVTFVISLFNKNVGMYEIHNNGGWYNFGFLMGLTAIWGGGGAASRRRRRS